MYLGLQHTYAYMNIRNFIYVCTLSVVPHLHLLSAYYL